MRIYISGTVQGVFFRGFIKENAEKLNLRGFVRNLEDGRVEVFIEGNLMDVKKNGGDLQKRPKTRRYKEY